MTTPIICPDCGAQITVTVVAEEPAQDRTPCAYCGRVPTVAIGFLHGKPACGSCVLLSRACQAPIIPGHGPLETKDASFDYGKETGG